MKQLKKIPRYAILVIFAAIAVTPFLWLLGTSLKGSEELFTYPPTIIPKQFVFANYSGVWNAVPFGMYYLNSVIIVVLTVLMNVVFSSFAGFALARFDFRYKNLIFFMVIGTMMIPKELIIIPVYTTILKIGLADTLAGVILPFAVEGFAVFMMRQAFLAIPKEIEEAAIMDGCSLFRLWWNIMTPMTKPTLATLAVFSFISSWGDFLWPLIVLKNPENYTLQVGLSYMTGTFVNNYRYIAAGAVLAVIPVLVVFLFVQKYFERGLFAGTGK
ncbi:MAG: carbohydrate ABC transporter permease [Bacteroidota bacterium]